MDNWLKLLILETPGDNLNGRVHGVMTLKNGHLNLNKKPATLTKTMDHSGCLMKISQNITLDSKYASTLIVTNSIRSNTNMSHQVITLLNSISMKIVLKHLVFLRKVREIIH